MLFAPAAFHVLQGVTSRMIYSRLFLSCFTPLFHYSFRVSFIVLSFLLQAFTIMPHLQPHFTETGQREETPSSLRYIFFPLSPRPTASFSDIIPLTMLPLLYPSAIRFISPFVSTYCPAFIIAFTLCAATQPRLRADAAVMER